MTVYVFVQGEHNNATVHPVGFQDEKLAKEEFARRHHNLLMAGYKEMLSILGAVNMIRYSRFFRDADDLTCVLELYSVNVN